MAIDIVDSISVRVSKMEDLVEDMQKMENDQTKKTTIRNSLQPITRLRGSVKEVQEAQANPDTQSIIDRIGDILGD